MSDSDADFEVSLPLPVPGGLFRHNASADILNLLGDSPQKSFGIRELARATNHPPNSISNAVSTLEEAGIVTTEPDGGKRAVSITRNRLTTPENPFNRIPQSDFVDPVQAFVNRAEDELESLAGVVLFGSVARGEADRVSDIDLFVVVDDDRPRHQRQANHISGELEEERFNGERYQYDVFVESERTAEQYGRRLREIFAEGITIVDSPAVNRVRRTAFDRSEVVDGGSSE